MRNPKPAIALGARLRGCANVLTLGVRPNFADYSPHEAALIREAPVIYHPGPVYAAIFDAMGKRVFPSRHTYDFAQDKVRQTALFQVLGVPHPRTRVYYGKKQQQRIREDFSFPFVAKTARGSALGAGVFLIRDAAALESYLGASHAAYIQEYVPLDRDIRVLVIGGEPVCAYWRVRRGPGPATNLARGGAVDFTGVPDRARDLAVETARACGFDDVGMDVCLSGSGPLVLEANMKYGIRGLGLAGMDYYGLMESLIRDGKI